LLFSAYGKEFKKDFDELTELGILFVFPNTISIFQEEIKKIDSIEKGKEVILEIIKFYIKNVN